MIVITCLAAILAGGVATSDVVVEMDVEVVHYAFGELTGREAHLVYVVPGDEPRRFASEERVRVGFDSDGTSLTAPRFLAPGQKAPFVLEGSAWGFSDDRGGHLVLFDALYLAGRVPFMDPALEMEDGVVKRLTIRFEVAEDEGLRFVDYRLQPPREGTPMMRK